MFTSFVFSLLIFVRVIFLENPKPDDPGEILWI